MMAEFFDITKDSKELFKDTKIMETEYASFINQYPTLFLSLANAKGAQISVVRSIKQSLIKLYQFNKYLFQDLDEFDTILYQGIIESLSQYNNGSTNGIESALSFLMEQLERYYDKKVMFFY